MPGTLKSELVQNDNFHVFENDDGALVIEHRSSGAKLELDDTSFKPQVDIDLGDNELLNAETGSGSGGFGSSGEEVMLKSGYSDAANTRVSSTDYRPVYDRAERCIIDMRTVDLTNISTVTLRHGFYRVSGPPNDESIEVRMSTFGNAPDPIGGLEYSVDTQNFRLLAETEIDISNYGVFTPNPQVRITGGTEEGAIQGVHTVEVVGTITE
jgi:hypothetical protein